MDSHWMRARDIPFQWHPRWVEIGRSGTVTQTPIAFRTNQQKGRGSVNSLNNRPTRCMNLAGGDILC